MCLHSMRLKCNREAGGSALMSADRKTASWLRVGGAERGALHLKRCGWTICLSGR